MDTVRLWDWSVHPVGGRQEIPPCLIDSPEQWIAETGEPHNVCGAEDGGQLHQAGEELDRNNPERRA